MHPCMAANLLDKKETADDDERYLNAEHVKGAVQESVPESFIDLSTVHRSLGSLSHPQVRLTGLTNSPFQGSGLSLENL